MKVIFTGDLQCEFENLDIVEEAVQQIRMEKPNILTILGDLKESYNPVDVRVVNYVIYMIDSFRKNDTKVIINPGNHDRVAMTNDRENWLPALEKAGALVAHEPRLYDFYETDREDDDIQLNLYMLPFRSNPDDVRKGAKELRDMRRQWSEADYNILCFHQGLKEAKYNDFRYAKEEPLSVEDLYPKRYDLVVGAHLHMHQRVKYDHVMYVGSPFATDWGEANQTKGYLRLEL